MEAKNALGALWCNRDDYSKAGEHLRLAADLYASRGAAGQEAKDTSSSSCGGNSDGHGDEASVAALPDDILGGEEGEQCSRLEDQHTMTLFYLAQVKIAPCFPHPPSPIPKVVGVTASMVYSIKWGQGSCLSPCHQQSPSHCNRIRFLSKHSWRRQRKGGDRKPTQGCDCCSCPRQCRLGLLHA